MLDILLCEAKPSLMCKRPSREGRVRERESTGKGERLKILNFYYANSVDMQKPHTIRSSNHPKAFYVLFMYRISLSLSLPLWSVVVGGYLQMDRSIER